MAELPPGLVKKIIKRFNETPPERITVGKNYGSSIPRYIISLEPGIHAVLECDSDYGKNRRCVLTVENREGGVRLSTYQSFAVARAYKRIDERHIQWQAQQHDPGALVARLEELLG